MQETWVRSPGQEDPLEEEMTTHSSILAWGIPWTEEPSGLQSMGSQRVRHNLATKHQKMGMKETPWQNWQVKRCPKQPRHHQYEDQRSPSNTNVRLTPSAHLPLQGAPHPAHAHTHTHTHTHKALTLQKRKRGAELRNNLSKTT